MKKLLFCLALFVLVGAGCNNSSMTQNTPSQEIAETNVPQSVIFAVNKTPLVGGPAYRLFENETFQEKKFNGQMITLTTEDFQKIEAQAKTVGSNESSKYYIVTANIQLEKITDTNDSIPGAPEFTYYEARILDIATIQ